MKKVFEQVDNNWQCDFELLETKTNKTFAVLEVKRIFKIHDGHIKLVDVFDGDTYYIVVILTTAICYELVFNKTNKECYTNRISTAVVHYLVKTLSEQQ